MAFPREEGGMHMSLRVHMWHTPGYIYSSIYSYCLLNTWPITVQTHYIHFTTLPQPLTSVPVHHTLNVYMSEIVVPITIMIIVTIRSLKHTNIDLVQLN